MGLAIWHGWQWQGGQKANGRRRRTVCPPCPTSTRVEKTRTAHAPSNNVRDGQYCLWRRKKRFIITAHSTITTSRRRAIRVTMSLLFQAVRHERLIRRMSYVILHAVATPLRLATRRKCHYRTNRCSRLRAAARAAMRCVYILRCLPRCCATYLPEYVLPPLLVTRQAASRRRR